MSGETLMRSLVKGSEVWKSCKGEGWAKMDGEERKG